MGKSQKSKIGFLFLLWITLAALAPAQNCDYFVDKGTVVIDGDEMDLQAGDVVCLEADVKPYILIQNIDPDDVFSEPVRIQNHDGQILIDTDHFYGISIQNSNNIILSGKGDDSFTYGIHIRRVQNGAGVGITDHSSKVEIEGLEIANTAISGLVAKTDPYCEDGEIKATRDDFTQRNIIIHDNYIHDTDDEGMYIGSAKYTGFTLMCNGEEHTVLPHVNEGVEVYDNVLERTGWDAIQVSSATTGCNIYDNLIFYDSHDGLESQMSGILIGGGSSCDCYNNVIADGKGDGIEALGKGNYMVYNNLIIRPGQSFFPGDHSKAKHGIFSNHIATEDNAYLYFYNNTIVSPKTTGITFRNDQIADARAYNNIITNPGAYDDVEDRAFIDVPESVTQFDRKSNLLRVNTADVYFDDPSEDDYDLLTTSPAINAGTNVSGFDFDIERRSRPHAGGWDIGAYESHKPGVGIAEAQSEKIQVKISPNPFQKSFSIKFSPDNRSFVHLNIQSVDGKNMFRRSMTDCRNKELELDASHWPSGAYMYRFLSKDGIKTGTIIKH